MSHLRFLPLFLLIGLILPVSAQDDEALLREYAADTWASFVALHPSENLLVADGMDADGTPSEYTSPTNIASYIWSSLAARDLGLIAADEALERISHEINVLKTLERHVESGQFYNWYAPLDGTLLRTWPNSTSSVCPFLSSVDNAWLAAALMMLKNAIPELAPDAEAILSTMHFDFYYDAGAGLFRGGYWPPDMQTGSCSTGFTGHHYGVLNSETRIVSYVAIALGQAPVVHYFKLARTFPPTCDWSWQEMKPQGDYLSYTLPDSSEISVFEGYYVYRGITVVPSWGGAMFEALMPNLLLPEATWGSQSWAQNHPNFIQAQIEHGLNEADYGYWGFSPSSEPNGGYREYGVDALGLDSNGYTSDAARTSVDYGFGDCAGRSSQSIPETYLSGVVTPHAVFLALEFAPEAALENLANLRADFAIYHEDFGFYDAVQVNNGRVAQRFLALDQGMILLALTNYLTDNAFKSYFAAEVEETLRPLLEMEVFGYLGE